MRGKGNGRGAGRYLYGMTKAEHIAYWRDTADDDWADIQRSIGAGAYVHGLFFAHLVIEKLSKAHWVKDNESSIPPRTHNIVKLWEATQLAPQPEHENIAAKLNDYQLEGRYPDYMKKLRARTTAAYTTALLTEIKTLRAWLLSTLP